MVRTWRKDVKKRAKIDEWRASLGREFQGAVVALTAEGYKLDELTRQPELVPECLHAIEHVPKRIEHKLERGHALSEEELAFLRNRIALNRGDERAIAAASASSAADAHSSHGAKPHQAPPQPQRPAAPPPQQPHQPSPPASGGSAAPQTSSALAEAAPLRPPPPPPAFGPTRRSARSAKPPRYMVARSNAARRVAARQPRLLAEPILARIAKRKETLGDRLQDREVAGL